MAPPIYVKKVRYDLTLAIGHFNKIWDKLSPIP